MGSYFAVGRQIYVGEVMYTRNLYNFSGALFRHIPFVASLLLTDSHRAGATIANNLNYIAEI